MTGGTARTVSRRLAPHVHSRNKDAREMLLFFIAGNFGSSGSAAQATLTQRSTIREGRNGYGHETSARNSPSEKP
jgi:hypothetical protein